MGLKMDNDMLFRSPVKYDAPEEGSNMASELLRALRRHKSRVLFVDTESGRHWTGCQLLEQVSKLATSLIRKVGLKPKDTVLMLCDHYDQSLIMVLAIVVAGGSLIFADPRDCFEEIAVICEIINPDIIVTHDRLQCIAARLKTDIIKSDQVPVVWIESLLSQEVVPSDASIISMVDLLNGPLDEQLIDHVTQNEIKPDQIFVNLLTSGTTSRPKFVPIPHEAFLHRCYSLVSSGVNPIGSAKNSTQPNQSNEEDYMLMFNIDSVFAGDLPFLHGVSLCGLFLALHLGCRTIIMNEYVGDRFLQAVHDHRITHSITSITATYRLLKRLKSLIDLGETGKWDLTCWSTILCTGSKLTFYDLVRDVNKFYNHLLISQSYGTTEVGFITSASVKDSRSQLDTVGYLNPGILAKVVDRSTGKLLGPNERGELHAWAKSMFNSYRCYPGYDPIQLTAECHDDQGFYKTGDWAHFDQEHRLHIHGRIKDFVLLENDFKVVPAELELIIDRHPLVEKSVLVGLPHPDLPGYNSLRAFVKLISVDSEEFRALESSELRDRLLAKDHQFIGTHICQFYASLTSEIKHLNAGIRIVDQFPTVGLLEKIDRKSLAKLK